MRPSNHGEQVVVIQWVSRRALQINKRKFQLFFFWTRVTGQVVCFSLMMHHLLHFFGSKRGFIRRREPLGWVGRGGRV